jgi:DhnA family fructose-bisphosphate aldolase class Ia
MPVPEKMLDRKLTHIRAGQYVPADFIIADAKDGDIGFGAGAPGPVYDQDNQPTDRMRPLADYRAGMHEMVRSGLVDIMLTSVSSAEALHAAGTYADTPVIAAVRVNDTTDIWSLRGGAYRTLHARPFRTARLKHARRVADLGLYSVTFYNDLDRDVATLESYAAFREEAEAVGMRHFLEVFNPAFPIDTGGVDLGFYVTDAIARALAGVASAERPLFLKMSYNGPHAMEELASFDPQNLIVGILGGTAGTTRDTMELVAQAERHGARVALFGRKIWYAESPLEVVRLMRRVIERDVSPSEAVRLYHDVIAKAGIRARRPLDQDSEVTDPILKAGAC